MHSIIQHRDRGILTVIVCNGNYCRWCQYSQFTAAGGEEDQKEFHILYPLIILNWNINTSGDTGQQCECNILLHMLIVTWTCAWDVNMLPLKVVKGKSEQGH